MPAWNAALYLRYGRERAQPARDLLARLEMETVPRRIVDLGCGPGNVTALLREKWPHAKIAGVDSSPEMLAAARREYSRESWQLADIAKWRAGETAPDLIFSNAALHWLAQHAQLMPQLLSEVAPGGALAVQMPSGENAPHRRMVRETAQQPRWKNLLQAPLHALTFQSPGFYYDVLQPHAARLELWETEYCHVMESTEAILDWHRGTGLRPFLEALENEEQRADFLQNIGEGYAREYSQRADGRVLFLFRRLFFIAHRER